MESRQLVLCSLLLMGLFFVDAAQAQTAGVVNLRANQTSATGSIAPVLTWSTNPVAQSCTASGGWSGTKAASGSQTLPVISTSTTFNLTCTWGAGSAVVRWTIPRTNTDGSAITNLASFKVMYGTSASALNQTLNVTDITRTSTTVNSLSAGRWYFTVRAVNTRNVESGNSSVWQKDVTGGTAAGNVRINVTAAPPSGTWRTVTQPVYDITTVSTGTRVLGQQVGLIAVGRPCDQSFRVTQKFYRVTRSEVTFQRTSRSTEVVARCLPQ